MLQKAFQRTDLGTFQELEDYVFSGQALLWIVWQEPTIVAAVVTRLVDTEKSRNCFIYAAGGSRSKDWLGLMSSIEQYAKQEQCDKLRAIGRKGWSRLLPDFRVASYAIEKDLR